MVVIPLFDSHATFQSTHLYKKVMCAKPREKPRKIIKHWINFPINTYLSFQWLVVEIIIYGVNKQGQSIIPKFFCETKFYKMYIWEKREHRKNHEYDRNLFR